MDLYFTYLERTNRESGALRKNFYKLDATLKLSPEKSYMHIYPYIYIQAILYKLFTANSFMHIRQYTYTCISFQY